MSLVMTIDELDAFLHDEFPQAAGKFIIDELTEDEVVVRRPATEDTLRPGGTVSGPVIFGLADMAVYIKTLAHIGPQGLAVTTNASIDFMRKPRAGADLVARCRLLKLGRVLVVGEVLINSQGDEKPVARASMTYSIPPK